MSKIYYFDYPEEGSKENIACLCTHKWFPCILKYYLASSLILRSPFGVSHEGNLRETEWNSCIARAIPLQFAHIGGPHSHATNNPSDRCNRLPRPRRWREPLITGNVTRSTRGSDTRRRHGVYEIGCCLEDIVVSRPSREIRATTRDVRCQITFSRWTRPRRFSSVRAGALTGEPISFRSPPGTATPGNRWIVLSLSLRETSRLARATRPPFRAVRRILITNELIRANNSISMWHKKVTKIFI